MGSSRIGMGFEIGRGHISTFLYTLEKNGKTIKLANTVHFAGKQYYNQINSFLNDCDIVLYETSGIGPNVRQKILSKPLINRSINNLLKESRFLNFKFNSKEKFLNHLEKDEKLKRYFSTFIKKNKINNVDVQKIRDMPIKVVAVFFGRIVYETVKHKLVQKKKWVFQYDVIKRNKKWKEGERRNVHFKMTESNEPNQKKTIEVVKLCLEGLLSPNERLLISKFIRLNKLQAKTQDISERERELVKRLDKLLNRHNSIGILFGASHSKAIISILKKRGFGIESVIKLRAL